MQTTQPTTLIQHITHNGTGDINAWQNAGGSAQKIDGRLFVAGLYVLLAGGAIYFAYGFMLGAMAFGMWIAPAVIATAIGAGTGIAGFAVYKRRLLARPMPAIEDVPATVIESAGTPVLPAQQPRALRSAEVAELVEFIEKDGRMLKEYEIDHIERQIIAQQPAAKILPLCASLPSPSESLPLRASQPGR